MVKQGIRLALLLTAGLLATSAGVAQTPRTQPVVTGVTYLHQFTVPEDDGRNLVPASRLSWSRFGMAAISEDGLYGYWVCHDQNDNGTNPPALAKVKIPAAGGVATITRPCTPMPNYADISPTDLGSGIKLGGALEFQGKLIVTATSFYDGAHVQQKSHWTCDTNIQDCTGPFRLTASTRESRFDRVGTQTRYMAPIAPEWRTLFGFSAFTGMAGGQISIIHRQSYGPTVTGFDPLKVGTPQAAQLLIGYPDEHQALGTWMEVTPYRATGGLRVGGVAFPTGSRSIVFIGSSGEKFCYGRGTNVQADEGKAVPDMPPWTWCYDPYEVGTNGGHAVPSLPRIWHYDANDALAVKNGKKQPWDLRPTLLPVGGPLGQERRIDGAAYDQTRGIWYLYLENPSLTVYVYRVDIGGGTPPPIARLKSHNWPLLSETAAPAARP